MDVHLQPKPGTLADVVAGLAALDPDATIYATEAWTCDSPAVVELEPEDGAVGEHARSLAATYFLEVSVAREFLDGWRDHGGHQSLSQQCERLIEYATYDA